MYFGLDHMSNVQPTKRLLFSCKNTCFINTWIHWYTEFMYLCSFTHLTQYWNKQISADYLYAWTYIHEMCMYLHTLQNKYTFSIFVTYIGYLCVAGDFNPWRFVSSKPFITYCLGSWFMWTCLTLVMTLWVRRISELSLISKVLLLRVPGDLPVMVIAWCGCILAHPSSCNNKSTGWNGTSPFFCANNISFLARQLIVSKSDMTTGV